MADREEAEAEVGEQESQGGLLQDLVKRALHSSINTMLTTEEGVRTVVETVVQKDLLGSAVAGVDATRREAVAIVGRELHGFLESLNVGEELAKILTSVSFEIRTEVRFIPNEDGVLRARVRSSAGPRRVQRADETEQEAPEDSLLPRHRPTRRAMRGLMDRLADVAAATARAAAEIAAEAVADVINEEQDEAEQGSSEDVEDKDVKEESHEK